MSTRSDAPNRTAAAGAVVWLTGLPSSGKTTLARALADRIEPRPVVLDGDAVRARLVPTPGYDPKARDDFYRTLAGLAAEIAEQGHLVLVAATAPRREHREAARALAPRFVDVHVATSIDVCSARDAKGLYQASKAGEVAHVPGVGAAYEEPMGPAIRVSGADREADVNAVLEVLATSGLAAR